MWYEMDVILVLWFVVVAAVVVGPAGRLIKAPRLRAAAAVADVEMS